MRYVCSKNDLCDSILQADLFLVVLVCNCPGIYQLAWSSPPPFYHSYLRPLQTCLPSEVISPQS
jgi:hypothetical protein